MISKQSAAPQGKCKDCETEPKESFCQPPSHPRSPLVSGHFFFFTSSPNNYQSGESQQEEIYESASQGPQMLACVWS